MKSLSALLIIGVVGTFGSRPDIDINRIKRISPEIPARAPYKPIRRSVQESRAQITRSNDYDDHSSWYEHARAPLPNVPDSSKTPNSKSPDQVYQPREDPRLFYQSDAYLKEYGSIRKNVNNEISFIYPGRNMVRAEDAEQFSRITSDEKRTNTMPADFNMCVKCPHDRMLVAKASHGRVVLQKPSLQMCSGQKAPRNVQFLQLYGPKFGSLLEQGSHMIIGRIMNKNKNFQLCKMQVHVVVQSCTTPKYLLAHCSDHNKQCNFTCRNANLELNGSRALTCGDDLRWQGDLPVCKARTWCPLPPPPEHGRVSCQGAPAGAGAGLEEGSRCRVRCARGWRSLRTTPVCRRGAWTHALVCQPKRNFIANNNDDTYLGND